MVKKNIFLLILLGFLVNLLLIKSVLTLSSQNLYSGSFNLYLNQNGSVGSQLLEYYVAIEYLNATPINTTANIIGKHKGDIYSSTLSFKTNTNGDIKILTNLDQTKNYMIRVLVNREEITLGSQNTFSFLNNDRIVIYFEVSNPIITKTHINAILGVIGIGLFCANPILSYILSDKAKDKFKFLFILMSIGILSVGLAFGFIYG